MFVELFDEEIDNGAVLEAIVEKKDPVCTQFVPIAT